VIQVRDLRVTLDRRRVLDGVSFRLASGEAAALTGPNGSGKTTILRCLLGLVPFQGEARVGGFDVVERPIEARRLIGYLPQRPAFGEATASEVLRFVARLRHISCDRIKPILEQVDLLTHAHQKARTFSSGMQQRLSLAVALLDPTPVLLLDEPTASLDREGQRSFLEIARRLRKDGRTLLLASHRAEEIAALTDRQIELENGQLLQPSNVVPLRRVHEAS